jgi:hypothetical protein
VPKNAGISGEFSAVAVPFNRVLLNETATIPLQFNINS